jgi:tetraacyldisaccharide 4'-kinase
VLKIEQFFESQQTKQGFSLGCLLAPFSLLYKLLIFLHQLFYRMRLRKTYSFSIPIICVGNIRVGGTGKTPFVQKLLSDLHSKINVAVVSTGYRALGANQHKILGCKDVSGQFVPASFCGDEASMLQRRFSRVDFYICKDRKKAVLQALSDAKDLVIFDDGFQHLGIQKDIEIVMLDPDCNLETAQFLPRGPLRDFPSRLACAAYVCLSYESLRFVDLPKNLKTLKKFTQAKILATRKVPFYLKGEWGGTVRMLKNKKIALFCGIARSQRFYDTVRNYEPLIKKIWTLRDHATFSEKALQEFSNTAQQEGAEFLLCTEKDYFKVCSIQTSLPKAYLEMQTEIIYGYQHYQKLLSQIIQLAKQRK